MSTISLDGIDFVRRILVDHHAGANLAADDGPETRLWHLFVTLCAYARTERIDISEVFQDAARYEARETGGLVFSYSEAGSNEIAEGSQ
jgi:hypothetical protein